jgi:hypothetical protein
MSLHVRDIERKRKKERERERKREKESERERKREKERERERKRELGKFTPTCGTTTGIFLSGKRDEER